MADDPLWPRAGHWPAGVPGRRTDAALVGVPTHEASLSPTNAHRTPAAVREALRRYSFESDLSIADHGDDADLAAIDAGLLIALGGDNSATVPVAVSRWGPARPGLITLDAHHDLRDGHSNGSPVRELLEAGLQGHRVVQIGIAEFANSRAYAQRAADHGITVVPRDTLHHRPMADVMAEALEIAGSGGGPVHLDLDVDVCDRSVAPACPASVPGGISASELRIAARVGAAHPAVASVDIVEVDATADAPDGRTVRLAALLVLESLAGYAERAR